VTPPAGFTADPADGGRRSGLLTRWATSSTSRPVSGCKRSPSLLTGTDTWRTSELSPLHSHKEDPRAGRNGGALVGRHCRNLAASPGSRPCGPALADQGVDRRAMPESWPAGNQAAMPPWWAPLARAAGRHFSTSRCSTPRRVPLCPPPLMPTRLTDRGHHQEKRPDTLAALLMSAIDRP